MTNPWPVPHVFTMPSQLDAQTSRLFRAHTPYARVLIIGPLLPLPKPRASARVYIASLFEVIWGPVRRALIDLRLARLRYELGGCVLARAMLWRNVELDRAETVSDEIRRLERRGLSLVKERRSRGDRPTRRGVRYGR